MSRNQKDDTEEGSKSAPPADFSNLVPGKSRSMSTGGGAPNTRSPISSRYVHSQSAGSNSSGFGSAAKFSASKSYPSTDEIAALAADELSTLPSSGPNTGSGRASSSGFPYPGTPESSPAWCATSAPASADGRLSGRPSRSIASTDHPDLPVPSLGASNYGRPGPHTSNQRRWHNDADTPVATSFSPTGRQSYGRKATASLEDGEPNREQMNFVENSVQQVLIRRQGSNGSVGAPPLNVKLATPSVTTAGLLSPPLNSVQPPRTATTDSFLSSETTATTRYPINRAEVMSRFTVAANSPSEGNQATTSPPCNIAVSGEVSTSEGNQSSMAGLSLAASPAAGHSPLSPSSSGALVTSQNSPTATNKNSIGANSALASSMTLSEEDQIRVAIEASQKDSNPVSSRQISEQVIREAKDCTNELLDLLRKKDIDIELLDSMLNICQQEQTKISNRITHEADSNGGELDDLLLLNGSMLEAIEKAEEAKRNRHKLGPSEPTPPIDVGKLIESRDVFTLICMLRASDSSDRLDAALAILKLVRAAENGDEEQVSIRDEIRSSGGIHSLLTLFRTRGTIYELRVVVGLAVAYLLPSFVQSTIQLPPALGLKIVECLRFLSSCRSVSPKGETIKSDEAFLASSTGLMSFWISHLAAKLNSPHSSADLDELTAPSRSLSRITSVTRPVSLRRKRNVGVIAADQRQEAIALQELLEMTIALVVYVSSRSDHASTHALVEQVCAVEIARPIAVREGILQVLLGWIKSGEQEKIREATISLRYLTSIKDKYMAGWIHSEMVNKGALMGLAALFHVNNISHEVRLAIAQIVASLCIAPHTRAAVVEANCISFLIPVLWEHSDQSSQEVAFFAGSALLQLAAGAITRAAVLSDEDPDGQGLVSLDKRDNIVEDIEKGTIQPFVSIAREHKGRLRTVAVEALRVISEDVSPVRQVRIELCNCGAVEALGITLKDNISSLGDELLHLGAHPAVFENDAVREIHEALCTLANIFDPIQAATSAAASMGQGAVLIKGCLDCAKCGGLEAILKVTTIPFFSVSLQSRGQAGPSAELLSEAYRSLASIAPLLLTDEAASQGCSRWAYHVLLAFDRVLRQLDAAGDLAFSANPELDIGRIVLQGVGALAKSEPLKVLIIDKALPFLMTSRGYFDRTEMASGSPADLDFAEDEVAVQICGSNADVLADWFCLQRSLLIQAMARDEIRQILMVIWDTPLKSIGNAKLASLIPWLGNSATSLDLFDSFADDDNTTEKRTRLLREYKSIYDVDSYHDEANKDTLDDIEPGLLSAQIYPLSDSGSEMSWILDHQSFLDSEASKSAAVQQTTSDHVARLLHYCFPSTLLRDTIIPLWALRPDAAFNFRALMMPQRRYFSFHREGQLISRLCDKESAPGSDVHWTLVFTNAHFSGEFAESLVQALYKCPMICGLSFSNNAKQSVVSETASGDESLHKGGLLPKLAGSLPPWVSHLTFDGVLSESDLLGIVAILETIGKLTKTSTDESNGAAGSLAQGKFNFLALRRSTVVSENVWKSFFGLLGGTSRISMNDRAPLSSLISLDISGNNLGDQLCADLLEIVYDRDSVTCLEHLDLSRNAIRAGTRMRNVFSEISVSQGSRPKRSNRPSKSRLETLRLADNELHLGIAWLDLLSHLSHNVVCLQVLDLSENGLAIDRNDQEKIGTLTAAILQSETLQHLNLSSNRFSEWVIDEILKHLMSLPNSSSVAFILFEHNEPSLSVGQKELLGQFMTRARSHLLLKYFEDQKQSRLGADNDDVGAEPPTMGDDLSACDDATTIAYDNQAPVEENSITVLFSAPLVYKDRESNLRAFARLDFDMEREIMWQCLREASRNIELSFDNATHNRLLAIMAKRCSVLHYSGHGHQKFLPFEDGTGGPFWFQVEDFRNLIEREGAVPFRFVFVSACYSGFAGETFAAAGVPHVVCCQQDTDLKDTAALQFTRNFYLSLAVGNTVREAFEYGCRAVRATPNLRNAEKEMKKFMLLPRDGNHDVPIFRAKPIAEWPRSVTNHLGSRSTRRGSHYATGARSSELGVRNMMQEDPAPSPPQFFQGREVELYTVLNDVLSRKLVSIVGETGVGRSALACALCHYINERKSTIMSIERIFFIGIKQSRDKNPLVETMKRLLSRLIREGLATSESDLTHADLESMTETVCRALKNSKALIVFDHIELLEEADEFNEFPVVLREIIQNTRDLRVLMTSRSPLGIPSLGEHHFQLGPLSFGSTVRLFANLCRHVEDKKQRRRLFSSLVTEDIADLLPSPDNPEHVKQIFTLFGNGIPATIEHAAYSIQKEVLHRLLNNKRGENLTNGNLDETSTEGCTVLSS